MPAQENSASPRIVVGVDGSKSSDSALRWAIRQAGLTGAAVDAVTAWQWPDMAGSGMAAGGMVPVYDPRETAATIAADAVSGALDPASKVPVRTRTAEGGAAQVLLATSADVTLLVVGSRGHGGFAEALLGSVSQHCVHHALCPVVVVRGLNSA